VALQTVFSNNLDPQNGSLTARFINATAFYIDAPMLNAELEIDVFLQVYFPTETGERLRNLALGKLKDGQITLNETDTVTVEPIPNEFLDSGLEMALFFLPSEPIFLEVYVLGKDCTVCGLDVKLDAIATVLNDLAAAQQNNNADLLLELIPQLLQLDAGIFTLAQGLSRLLPQGQRRNFRQNIERRLSLDRNFL